MYNLKLQTHTKIFLQEITFKCTFHLSSFATLNTLGTLLAQNNYAIYHRLHIYSKFDLDNKFIPIQHFT